MSIIQPYIQKCVGILPKCIHCLGNFGNCSTRHLCGEDEADCHNDLQCKPDHKCGIDSCRSSLGLERFYDCCIDMAEDMCTFENPCEIDEGDCDSHSACLEGLACGLNNCPGHLGFEHDVDCCYTPIQITHIMSPNYPSLYPSNVKKTWLLTAPVGSTINLQFQAFYVRIIIPFYIRTSTKVYLNFLD